MPCPPDTGFFLLYGILSRPKKKRYSRSRESSREEVEVSSREEVERSITMSYKEKIEKARTIIEAHNANCDDDKSKVNADEFIKKLKAEGGTSDEAISSCSFEDLGGMGLPKLLAKQVAQIFRGKDSGSRRPMLSATRVDSMSVKGLLEHYDPREPTNKVGTRLVKISKGKRCIVFTPDGKVDVEASEVLVNEVRDGFPERPNYTSGTGAPRKLYRVGERPGQYANENPCYPGRMLRPDGTCDQTNRSWNGVSTTVRQIIYLAITDTHELKIDQVNDAHGVLDLAVADGAEGKLRHRYPQTSVLFDELQGKDDLPSLKIPLRSSASGAGASNRDDTGFVRADD